MIKSEFEGNDTQRNLRGNKRPKINFLSANISFQTGFVLNLTYDNHENFDIGLRGP
jgi:hypothetical protein